MTTANRHIFVAGGITVGLGVATLSYLAIRKKKRDKLASELLRALTKLIKPATAGLLSENAFDIHYKEKVLSHVRGKIKVLKPEFTLKYAKEIKGAWGFLNDDENKVYAVFRKLRDKVQVAQVAKAYQDTYKENLIDVLHDKLSESEIKKVLDIVNAKAEYRLT